MELKYCHICGSEYDIDKSICNECGHDTTLANDNETLQDSKITLVEKLLMGFAIFTLILPVISFIVLCIILAIARQI